MAERHLDALLASAYDGRLDAAQRRRFDSHLAGCERCAAAFADHCAAADALRSLPAARMPVTVHLPAHAPRAAHAGLLERLRLRPALVAPLLAGAVAAAVVVVAVAVHNGGSGSRETLAQAGAASSAADEHGGVSSSSSSAFSNDQVVVPAPQGAAGGGAGLGATAFTNIQTVEQSGRAGEVLVVATTSKTYAPGATVEVDARLVAVPAATAAPAADAPAQGGGRSASETPPGPGAPQANVGAVTGASVLDLGLAPVLARPSVSLLSPAFAAAPAAGGASPSPVAVGVAEDPGFFRITIPATARPGDVFTIVATVPAGVPSSADEQAVTALLQITIA